MTDAFDFDACARAGREVTELIGSLREMIERYPPITNGHDIFVSPEQVRGDLEKAHEAISSALAIMQTIKFPCPADYQAHKEAALQRASEKEAARLRASGGPSWRPGW